MAVDRRDVVRPADVRMRDLARDPNFAAQLLQLDGIRLDTPREKLQRDRLAKLEIVGAIDLAHAAAAEEGRRCGSASRDGCPARRGRETQARAAGSMERSR